VRQGSFFSGGNETAWGETGPLPGLRVEDLSLAFGLSLSGAERVVVCSVCGRCVFGGERAGELGGQRREFWGMGKLGDKSGRD
jgi:hypothetical protein